MFKKFIKLAEILNTAVLIKLKLITQQTLVIYIWCAITPRFLIKINIASFAKFSA